jgi:hypothetical protein
VLRQWQRRVLEVLATGVGSVVAVALAGGVAWAIVGALAGLLLVFGVEWGVSVRAKLQRLAELEREAESLRQTQELLRQRTEAAQREAAVSGAWTEVSGGVVSEAMTTGHVVPLAALMARADMTLKARGLDAPVKPPTTNPPLPES